LTVDGGTLSLTGSNTFTGTARVSGGMLRVIADANLGSPANSITFAGGTFQSAGNFTTARAMSFGGTGGAIDITGANVLSSSGTISGSGTLRKSGTGTLRLTAASTFGGSLQIDPAGGTVSLASANGAINSVNAIAIALGGGLELNNATSAGGNHTASNRIADTAALTFNGGALSMIGADGKSSTESLGAISLLSSSTTISLANGNSGTTTLSFASLARTLGANLSITGVGIGTTNRVLLRTAPTSIGTWLKVNGLSAKYDSTAGLVPTTFPLSGPTPDLLWGDANMDGAVDGLDYTTTFQDMGLARADWEQGDFNGDGVVNQEDLNLLLTNAQASLVAVPEPNAGGIGAIVICGAMAFMRRLRLRGSGRLNSRTT
jgi:autotransporter-associated beta strand protein